MKKTFISLFLLSLLTVFGSLSVKADPVKTLSFVYTSAGNDKYCNGNDSESGKGAVGGDFQWSGKIEDAIQKSGDWMGVNGNTTACSRSTSKVHLDATGDYTFTMDVKWTEHGNHNLPRITIAGQSEKTPDMGSSVYFDDNETKTIVYTFNELAAGDYDISVYFQDGARDKQFVQTLVISSSAPAAPTYEVSATASNGTVSGTGSFAEGATVSVTANFVSSPCTNTLIIQCEDYVSYNTKPSGSNDNKPENLKSKDYTGYGDPIGGYYADFDNSTGEMWIPVTLPAGTFTFTVRYVKGGNNMWFNLYDVSNNSKIANSKQLSQKGDSWDSDVSNSYTLTSGDYVIGIYGNDNYTGLDQITITASSNVFCLTDYEISLVNTEGGSAAPTAEVNSSAVTSAESGTTVTVTAAEANSGYYFSGWTASPEVTFAHPTSATTTFEMPASNVTITANYTTCTQHTVTLAANNGSYGSVDGDGLQCDGSVTVTATPNTGYRFVNWTQGDSQVSTDAVYTFTLSEDISLTANFAVEICSNNLTIQCEDETIYRINSSLLTKGKPTPEYGTSHSYYSGADGDYVDFKGTAGEHYYMVHLPAATYSFTVYKAHAGNSYLNIWEAGIGDELTYNGVNYGKHHGDAYNIIGDNDGYEGKPIHNSTVSNITLSAGTYIIGLYGNDYAVYDKVVITANTNVFCPTYDITMVNNMGGAAPTADKVKAEENASVSISAAETIGEFSFTGWTASSAVTFVDASAANTTFTMPDEAVTITANYNTYSRTGAPAIQNGHYGTICLPLNGTVTGATLYSVAGSQEEGGKLYIVLEEQDNLEAGKPYIFQLSADELSVALDGTYTDLQSGNGLVGTYTEIENLTPYDDTHHNYVLNANAFKKAGNNVTVGAYRAYLNWDAVGAVTPAPGARRIRMVIEGKEVETGMETVTAMPKTTKVLIDGQLFIIREGKRYTLTGARAQ